MEMRHRVKYRKLVCSSHRYRRLAFRHLYEPKINPKTGSIVDLWSRHATGVLWLKIRSHQMHTRFAHSCKPHSQRDTTKKNTHTESPRKKPHCRFVCMCFNIIILFRLSERVFCFLRKIFRYCCLRVRFFYGTSMNGTTLRWRRVPTESPDEDILIFLGK